MKTLILVASLAAAALPVSASAGHSPGVTDVPSAAHAERYVPFVTDFPSRAPEAAPAAAAASSEGFDALDAAVGAAVGLALGALGAASLPALRRREGVAST
jgi:hypothetical protein